MRSDNLSGVSEKVMQAIINENNGLALAYSEDDVTAASQENLRALFENKDLVSYNLVTGTATNTLILATLCPTFGAIFCHEKSHIYADECGGVEFQTGGAKLHPISGKDGKMIPSAIEDAIGHYIIDEPHHSQPAIISIANSTEAGTIYSPDEVAAISEVAKKHNLKLHMDGARFANAVVANGCSPADLTWKAGVDALSFGTTKNGTLGAETAIFFNASDDKGFVYRRMRSGHLVSKSRYVSAQINAYIDDNHWLDNAKHANDMADKLKGAILNSSAIDLLYPMQTNILFVKMIPALNKALEESGAVYYSWGVDDLVGARFVTAFNTPETDIERMIEVIGNF
ncbi:threonine aldolase family protein [Pseudemcibacter aquimaris]|uniref:threonine aldolase family protein n=1 Tax=Pseudemcibacter aquimaris TaxID=2857064 RepID=UPI002013A7A0|nr:beta-eliminating lyase-related protein [Pseudemcibacter aquimaris]MCC3861338.1 hypothetical protein [Pseudemcibacter aquimaris]WDU58110.1 hypothetical protein KW060_13010 [Pseudemcibacter aquimaris]